jgi:hypothetical protein
MAIKKPASSQAGPRARLEGMKEAAIRGGRYQPNEWRIWLSMENKPSVK